MTEMPETSAGRPSAPLGPGDWPVRWIHGSPPGPGPRDPPVQVHRYDAKTFILRQSKDVSFEAPFLYLFFGHDRALLVDSGAIADPRRCPLRSTVDGLVRAWRSDHPRSEYPLVVAHTHGHGDHVAGDSQFADRPNTRVVGRDASAVREYFGLSDGPAAVATLDLGGRPIEVLAIPGHHPASIALYDRRTGLLLTGDTVCPGRLYVADMPAFRSSMARLVGFARTHPVSAVVGGHIEMTARPGIDYPIGARYQPHERILPMDPGRLDAILEGAHLAAKGPGVYVFPDFHIYHGPCTGPALWSIARGKVGNLRYRIVRGLHRVV